MSRLLIPLNALARHWAIVLLMLFLVTPMLVIVVFSLDANRFPGLPMGGFSLQWYEQAFNNEMVRAAFANTFWVALGTAVISTVLGFCAAYVDYRYRFRGQTAFNLLVLVAPAVPASILGMAMLAFLSRTGLSGERMSIVLCHVAIATSFATALVRLRLREIDADLEAAGWNLGASELACIRYVIIPFCARSIAAAFFLSAAVSFDDYMIAWFVGGVHETVPVRLLNQLQGQVNPIINAIGSLVLLVSVSLVLLAQWLVRSRAGAGH
jgi:spermidine/putrescine transport system permease protein